MDEIDDITLQKAKQGNAQAFRKLYGHYSPFVWRLCYRSSNGDAARAEELMQDTFVKVHRYLGSFSRDSAFSTWLYRVAYNCINEFFAKTVKINSREAPLDDGHGAADASASPYENREYVAKMLAPLSETERFLLTAREVEGLPYEELAAITGIKEGALRTRIARIKADIREKVEKLDKINI